MIMGDDGFLGYHTWFVDTEEGGRFLFLFTELWFFWGGGEEGIEKRRRKAWLGFVGGTALW